MFLKQLRALSFESLQNRSAQEENNAMCMQQEDVFLSRKKDF